MICSLLSQKLYMNINQQLEQLKQQQQLLILYHVVFHNNAAGRGEERERELIPYSRQSINQSINQSISQSTNL